jgi:hypothetical protein
LRRKEYRVEVLNFGVNGYGPIQELLLFKQEAPRYQPNLVILALFLDNDIADVHPKLKTAPESPFIEMNEAVIKYDYSRAENSFKDYHKNPKYFLRRHLALYRFLYYWQGKLKIRKENKILTGKNIPTRYGLYQKPLRAEWEKAWRTFERIILEFKDEALKQNVDFLILNVPAGQLVSGKAWENVLNKNSAMRDMEWDLGGPERRMNSFVTKNGITYLDAVEWFKRNSTEVGLFFGDVGHFTHLGHQLMAEFIENYVVNHALIPERFYEK